MRQEIVTYKCDRCKQEMKNRPPSLVYSDKKLDYRGTPIVFGLHFSFYGNFKSPDFCEKCILDLLKIAVHEMEVEE